MQVFILRELIKVATILLEVSKYSIVITLVFIFSCNDFDKKTINLSSIDSTTIINKGLYRQIDAFIDHLDSVDNKVKNKPSPNIVIVSFNSVDGNCIINIYSQFYYDSQLLNGFFTLKNKMIAFYNIDNTCNNGFAKKNKLKKEVDEKYLNENSKNLDLIYEPMIWSFKINNTDTQIPQLIRM